MNNTYGRKLLAELREVGKVHFYKSSSNRYLYLRCDLEELGHLAQSEAQESEAELVTAQEAASELGVDLADFNLYAQKGYIETIVIESQSYYDGAELAKLSRSEVRRVADDLLTIEEACGLLGVSHGVFQDWKKGDLIPFTKFDGDRRHYYQKAVIVELAQRRQEKADLLANRRLLTREMVCEALGITRKTLNRFLKEHPIEPITYPFDYRHYYCQEQLQLHLDQLKLRKR